MSLDNLSAGRYFLAVCSIRSGISFRTATYSCVSFAFLLKVSDQKLFLWGIILKSSTRINGPVELGQYLLKERKQLKLTQKEISEFADVGRKFIIELEKGKATAQLGKVFELLNSLGLELHLVKRGDS
jgi:HTH-type transcriptional regulator / antitoxin HipB